MRAWMATGVWDVMCVVLETAEVSGDDDDDDHDDGRSGRIGIVGSGIVCATERTSGWWDGTREDESLRLSATAGRATDERRCNVRCAMCDVTEGSAKTEAAPF